LVSANYFLFSSPESVVWARRIVVRSPDADAAETRPILNHCPLVTITGCKMVLGVLCFENFCFPSEFRSNVHLTRIFGFHNCFTVDDFYVYLTQ
jgi:hypothetical protein